MTEITKRFGIWCLFGICPPAGRQGSWCFLTLRHFALTLRRFVPQGIRASKLAFARSLALRQSMAQDTSTTKLASAR